MCRPLVAWQRKLPTCTSCCDRTRSPFPRVRVQCDRTQIQSPPNQHFSVSMNSNPIPARGVNISAALKAERNIHPLYQVVDVQFDLKFLNIVEIPPRFGYHRRLTFLYCASGCAIRSQWKITTLIFRYPSPAWNSSQDYIHQEMETPYSAIQ